MAIPLLSALIAPVAELGKVVVSGVIESQREKRAIKKAVTENKIRLAQEAQTHNHEWEMRGLENAGWKDEVLFLAILAMYIYSAFDPEGARHVFDNWEVMPEWFQKITFWLVASIVGVKKLGDYLPPLVSGVKEAFKK